MSTSYLANIETRMYLTLKKGDLWNNRVINGYLHKQRWDYEFYELSSINDHGTADLVLPLWLF